MNRSKNVPRGWIRVTHRDFFGKEETHWFFQPQSGPRGGLVGGLVVSAIFWIIVGALILWEKL
jgi:hypothetical protein